MRVIIAWRTKGDGEKIMKLPLDLDCPLDVELWSAIEEYGCRERQVLSMQEVESLLEKVMRCVPEIYRKVLHIKPKDMRYVKAYFADTTTHHLTTT